MDIEALEEILESLRITEGYALDRNRAIEISIDKVSIVPTPEVYNNIKYIVILKSMILDLG